MSINNVMSVIKTIFSTDITDINAVERLAKQGTTQFVFASRPSNKSIFPTYSVKQTGGTASSYAAGEHVLPSETGDDVDGYKLTYAITISTFVKRRRRKSGTEGFTINGVYMSNAKLADYLANELSLALFKNRNLFDTYPLEGFATKPSVSEVYLETEDVFAADVSFVVETLHVLTAATPVPVITEFDDEYFIDFTI